MQSNPSATRELIAFLVATFAISWIAWTGMIIHGDLLRWSGGR